MLDSLAVARVVDGHFISLYCHDEASVCRTHGRPFNTQPRHFLVHEMAVRIDSAPRTYDSRPEGRVVGCWVHHLTALATRAFSSRA